MYTSLGYAQVNGLGKSKYETIFTSGTEDNDTETKWRTEKFALQKENIIPQNNKVTKCGLKVYVFQG